VLIVAESYTHRDTDTDTDTHAHARTRTHTCTHTHTSTHTYRQRQRQRQRHRHTCSCAYVYEKKPYPHEKLLRNQQVSNPSTISARNQQISTKAHSLQDTSKWTLSSEQVVQIDLKGAYGVETLPPRSFWCGLNTRAWNTLKKRAYSEKSKSAALWEI